MTLDLDQQELIEQALMSGSVLCVGAVLGIAMFGTHVQSEVCTSDGAFYLPECTQSIASLAAEWAWLLIACAVILFGLMLVVERRAEN